MGKSTLHSDLLLKLLLKRRIAILAELKTALGTNATMTVFRKLRDRQETSWAI